MPGGKTPDGQRIAYVRLSGASHLIEKQDLKGGEPTLIVSEARLNPESVVVPGWPSGLSSAGFWEAASVLQPMQHQG